MYGELGNGGTSTKRLPVRVLENVTAVATHNLHNLAIKSDSSLWAWGRNDYGQLGDGTTTDRYSPVPVLQSSSPMTGVATIAAGGVYSQVGHSLALKTNGTLWAWGWNASGQLADTTKTSRSSPVPVVFTGFPVVVNATGSGQITSTDSTISCPTTCSANYPVGTVTTLTATSNPGWEFTGWGGACTGTASSCTVTSVTTPTTVTATFTQQQYGLAVSGAGSGAVTSSPVGINCGSDCNENYGSGTLVTLTANPVAGWQFTGWGATALGPHPPVRSP
jgi:hypothetical protein